MRSFKQMESSLELVGWIQKGTIAKNGILFIINSCFDTCSFSIDTFSTHQAYREYYCIVSYSTRINKSFQMFSFLNIIVLTYFEHSKCILSLVLHANYKSSDLVAH